MIQALQAHGLGKRYGQSWGLQDCSFEIPPASVVGLVGPNGAGKSTLLQLIVGLLKPTTGQIQIFGENSTAHRAKTLARVAYVAQDHPLYADFSVADMLRLGRSMNPNWDQAAATDRVRGLEIPFDRRVKALSGGQQAQVALAMALAKRAPLLVLDEPVASLDPVARVEFMKALMAAVAEKELTVVISSHVVSELERICDWAIVLSGGLIQLAGPVDDLLDQHRMLTGPRAAASPAGAVHRVDSDRHTAVLARVDPLRPPPAGWRSEPVGFEETVLAYLRRPVIRPATNHAGLTTSGPDTIGKAVSQ